MARAGCRTNGLQKLDGDDIEKSIEVLDKVLSEFEDPDSLPHIPIHIEPESPSQGNQSEDDGYMSMNGRRAKMPSDFHQPLSNESLASPSSSSSGAPMVLEQYHDNHHPIDDKKIIDIKLSTQSSTVSNESVGVDVVSVVQTPIESSNDEIISNLLPKISSPPSPQSPTTTAQKISVNSSSINDDDTDRINNAKNNLLDNKNLSNGLQISYNSSDNIQLQSTVNDGYKLNDNDSNAHVINPQQQQQQEILNEQTVGKIIQNSRENVLIIPKLQQNIIDRANLSSSTATAQQTTLPKTRPSSVIPSRYASLPCSGQVRGVNGTNLDRFGRGQCGGSFDASSTDDRNILGIDISAVHDAVLRGGVAKLPEPIVNEHPVTIYPGRASPPGRRVPPRTLPGSIEKHREVCRSTDLSSANHDDYNAGMEIYFDDDNDDTDQQSQQSQQQHCSQFSIFTEHNDPKMISQLHRIAITKSPSSPLVSVQQHIILQNSVSSNQLIDNKNLLNSLQIPPNKPQRKNLSNDGNNDVSGGGGVSGGHNNLINCNNNFNFNNNQKSNKRQSMISDNDSSSSSEDFSDDSLEGQSLPPPPGPPIVPPPPSLSAPVTPSKRGSIAWEISLDDYPVASGQQHNQHNNNKFQNNSKNNGGKSSKCGGKNSVASSVNNGKDKSNKLETSASAKLISRRRGRSQNGGGSQSSLASTPGNSIGSMSNQNSPQHHHNNNNNHQAIYFNEKLKNRSSSMEWPEITSTVTDSGPAICSTEDEAASIYSDSDDLIPSYPINMVGKGTYVIRKGRKERNRLSDIHTSMSSSINSRLSNEGSMLSGMTISQSLLAPNSRHSIDLGSTPSTAIQSPTSSGSCLPAMLSPRTRLSLDLNSPNHVALDHPPVSLRTILCSSSDGPNTNQTQSQQHINTNSTPSRYTNDFNKFASYETTINQQHETNGNKNAINTGNLNNNNNNNSINNSTGNINGSLTRLTPQSDAISTPRRELAPPIEEDEEQDSESQSRGAPLRQIENNISALLRGDIAVARVGDIPQATRRPLGFRPGVHKSESAKEMLLSQTPFGPLPPSPQNSSPEPENEIDCFPPLPPSPQEIVADDEDEIDDTDMVRGLHGIRLSSRTRLKTTDHLAPAVPPHRSNLSNSSNIVSVGGLIVNHHAQPSVNTLKTRSMDAGYTKKYLTNSSHSNVPGTLPGEMPSSNSSRRRLQSGAFPKRAAQSPREERRLQTSCSLPETPIFARGCDIPRTPHRRAPETPPCPVGITCGGSRTAPRTNTTTSLGSSIVGIGNTTYGGGGGVRRPLTGADMLRLAGGPARGWYPKQRTMRPASTEHLDRLHRSQGSRAWDGGGSGGMSASGCGGVGGRKPLTLPPNLTPKFFNKSPREALRRVTSLLIKKGNSKDKESKHRDKESYPSTTVHSSSGFGGDLPINQIYINNGNATASSGGNHTNPQPTHKKKGFFKNFWKKSKHYSLDQQ